MMRGFWLRRLFYAGQKPAQQWAKRYQVIWHLFLIVIWLLFFLVICWVSYENLTFIFRTTPCQRHGGGCPR